MEDDQLELLLGVQFKGLEAAKSYADAVKSAARAEGSLARQAQKANEQMRESAKLREGLGSMPGMAPNNYATSSNRISGLNTRAEAAQKADAWAQASGTDAQKADARTNLSRAREAVEKAKRPQMTSEMQALYSTRMNLPGGAAPLLGKTLEAAVGPAATRGILAGLAPLVKAFGPMALAASLAKEGLEAVYEAAKQQAEITNRLTSAQATSGGSVGDAARLGLVGGSADAAKGVQERITSDPQAMASAASLGVSNLKGQYGNLNWTKQYLSLIEKTANVSDESLRRRLALTLGIEQEVARYSLLSERTRLRIKEQGNITGMINDPAAQRLGAEFETSRQMMSSANDNLKSAAGQLVSADVASAMNDMADVLNSVATAFKTIKPGLDAIKEVMKMLPGGAIVDILLGHDSWMTPSANADRAQNLKDAAASKDPTQGSSLMGANTQQLMNNTQALSRLNSTIGGGQYSREALPSALMGANLQSAIATRSLRLGALG